MRRSYAILLSFAVLAGSAGCGSGVATVVAPVAPVTPTPPATPTPPVTTPPVTTPPVTPTPPTDPPLASQCKATVARPSGPAAASNFAGAAFTGKVLAGSTPMVGASVQIYAAASAGNGSAPTPLGPAVTTDAAGGFTVAGGFTCPYDLSVLYAVSRGGHAGAAGAGNAAAVLMAALGTCQSVTGASSFVIDEATTVAAAYALGQFMTAGAQVGASSTNIGGLALAAATAANLVNPATGKAPGATFPTSGTAPSLRLNALANALNACVVSTPAPGGACAQLYAAAAVGTATPSNTLDAALNLARNPASNVAAVFALASASRAFSPALTSAPADWTMFVTYSGGGMSGPSGLGVDSAGNIRVANYFDVASFFSNTGVPAFASGITGNNLHESYGLAVDQHDNAWIPVEQTSSAINAKNGTVVVLNSAGQSVAGATGFSTGGINFPVAVAIDSSGTSWVVDYGNSHLTLLSNVGVPLSGTSGYTTDQFAFPVAVAVDSKCYGFVANQSGTTITRVPQDGSAFKSFVTGSGASGVAVDAADNVWVANYYGSTVGLLSSAGVVVSAGYTGGGIDHPQGIAVDGAGNVWVANYRAPALTELAGAAAALPGAALSPPIGLGKDAGLLEAFGIAIDASGNVWVTNFGNNTLTEFVGLAVPVRTPLIGPVAAP